MTVGESPSLGFEMNVVDLQPVCRIRFGPGSTQSHREENRSACGEVVGGDVGCFFVKRPPILALMKADVGDREVQLAQVGVGEDTAQFSVGDLEARSVAGLECAQGGASRPYRDYRALEPVLEIVAEDVYQGQFGIFEQSRPNQVGVRWGDHRGGDRVEQMVLDLRLATAPGPACPIITP